MKGNQNPLFDTQREKAGAKTYEKYSYQYHWALYRVLDEHKKLNEYAVFVELHEDVVIADSLDNDKARFEFNQVKTNKTSFNTFQLVQNKKNGKSVLGKLVSSGFEKPFSDRIDKLNLVALNKFNLDLKEDKIDLEIIRIEDLSDNQFIELENEIKKELNIDALPTNIQFVIPNLSENNFQNDVIASIAKLISNLFPGSYCNPVEIYRLLIDEVNRKGTVTYDFKNWDELLSKKALTSITVTRVINEFTNLKDEAKIESEFNSICFELGLKSIESKRLRQSFNRYRCQRISNSSTIQMDTTKFITKEIQTNIENGVVSLDVLINNVQQSMPTKIGKQFTNIDDVKSAIICEYIIMD
jgi:hypothetical protein